MKARSYLQKQAYLSIKEKILTGELVADTMYSETKLAAQIGISRTPVREALQALVQDGYITVIPSRGFMIRRLDRHDMRETIQVRCAVEGFCVQYIASETGSAAYKRLIAQLQHWLEQLQDSIEDEDFPENFIKYDQEFHLCMVRYVDNEEITRLYQRSIYLIQLTSAAALSVPGRVQATVDEHRDIFHSLKAGDGDAAYRNIIAHLMFPLNMHLVE